jgi:hypothetical protein
VRTSDEALDKLRLAVARQPGTVADAEIFEDESPFSILKGTAAAQTKELIVMHRGASTHTTRYSAWQVGQRNDVVGINAIIP